jgi:exosortase E/protease (VPEID-CTERM system)
MDRKTRDVLAESGRETAGNDSSPPRRRLKPVASLHVNRWDTLGLPARAAILAALFFVEKIFLAHTGSELFLAHQFGFQFIVAFVTALTVFAMARRKARPLPVISPAHPARIQPAWMVAHLALVACLAWLSSLLFPATPAPISLPAVVCLWLVFGAAAVFCAFAAMAPAHIWLKGARALGKIWLYSAAAALAAAVAVPSSRDLWWSMTGATFHLVRFILLPILPGLTVDPATRVLSTQTFAVKILPACSGLEGVSLILVFTIAWLWYFRKEYRFPGALCLIPLGMALMFAMNAVRIAVLVLIGYAGYPEVASVGFHSQAGWIAFNAVAIGITVWSQRARWWTRGEAPPREGQLDNPTALFLMPLLAILAAGMLSHAFSGRFEWLYPLRLLACLSVLVIYRRRLAALEWRGSWRGVLAGIGVFAVWYVGLRYFVQNGGPPQELAVAPPSLRWAWIGCRVVASVVTVPLAEELAYRGFLMRRLQSGNFDSLAYERVGWVALLASSLLFGAAHGAMWLPGTIAGFVYGWIAKRQGQLGEAVAAHATTNLLVAALALGFNDWAGF